MDVNASTWGWIGLALTLFLSSFGPLGGLWLVIYAIAFIGGFVGMLIYTGRIKYRWWLKRSRSLDFPPPPIGIPKLVNALRAEKPSLKIDKRMTGSSSIDDVLQEVLEYTYRDYIRSWYRRISDDEQFQYDIRTCLQRVIIALSERAKDVDLVPYLTTRLVDDFGSHIRLYRKAITKVKEHQKDDTKPPCDMESVFFDFETEMENNICRDNICMNDEGERQYLQDLSEVLLFLLLPPDDFHNKPFRYIVRDVLVNGILLPTINLVTDPDYLNQTICWLCKENTFTNDTFLTILKTSDNTEELQAIKEKVDLDIARQRSKDTGGDNDTVIKQQLSSLLYVKQVCETRIQRLKDGIDEPDITLVGGLDINKLLVPGQKLYSLPFDVVLNNNVALAFFIEFMTNIGAQSYLFFYLTVEGYRVSAEQQISAAMLTESDLMEKPDLESLRDAATSIFNQYLSDKASPKLQIDENLVKTCWDRMQHYEPSDCVFDDIQSRIWDLLQEDEKFFPAFKKSQLYIKLLAELDLLHKQDDEDIEKDDEKSLQISSSEKNSSATPGTVEDLDSSYDSMSSSESSLTSKQQFVLTSSITNTGICREHGKQYAVYLITVTRHFQDNTEEVWDVYRRYSDFHDLHMILVEKFEGLTGLVLPGKKTFNNMNKDFLEKRRHGLNAYLQTLLAPTLLNSYRGLLEIVYNFLEHIHWEREKSDLARKMDTIVNPLKNSVKSVGSMVKSMPDNFVDGIAKMSGGVRSIPNNMLDGVGKILNVKGTSSWPNLLTMLLSSEQPPGSLNAIKAAEMLDSGKVGASLDTEHDDDNIPLRIMLLMMDEVFELKNRNQWLRRRIVAILRQIIKTMFGDSINRKIVEYWEWMSSADQIAEYIKAFRDAFWPNGILADPKPPRDHSTKMRTRVVAKAKMTGSLSDELRHFIGSESCRLGVLRIFNMFQHPVLNRRMAYVILEGLLETVFYDNEFREVFRKMHSRSPRVKKEEPVKVKEETIPLKRR